MLSEEASIIAGLLVGLNSFDVSIDLKSELSDIDQPVKEIYSKVKILFYTCQLIACVCLQVKTDRLQSLFARENTNNRRDT